MTLKRDVRRFNGSGIHRSGEFRPPVTTLTMLYSRL